MSKIEYIIYSHDFLQHNLWSKHGSYNCLVMLALVAVTAGQNVFNENETIAKYEIMDGAPVRGTYTA